jgi:hypothetical protein
MHKHFKTIHTFLPMKKILTLAILSSTLLMHSCVREEVPTYDQLIVASWRLTDIRTTDGLITTTTTGLPTTTVSFSEFGKNFNNCRAVFSDRPAKTYVSSGSFVYERTRTLYGTPITQDVAIPLYSNNNSWSISGNTLNAFSTPSGGDKATIITLNDDTLKLRTFIDSTNTSTSGGVTTSTHITATYNTTFVREY